MHYKIKSAVKGRICKGSLEALGEVAHEGKVRRQDSQGLRWNYTLEGKRSSLRFL